MHHVLDWLLDVALVDRYANLDETSASNGTVEVCDPSVLAERLYLSRWI
jgi:hypothetical protein